jgi:hypothetical protein
MIRSLDRAVAWPRMWVPPINAHGGSFDMLPSEYLPSEHLGTGRTCRMHPLACEG